MHSKFTTQSLVQVKVNYTQYRVSRKWRRAAVHRWDAGSTH